MKMCELNDNVHAEQATVASQWVQVTVAHRVPGNRTPPQRIADGFILEQHKKQCAGNKIQDIEGENKFGMAGNSQQSNGFTGCSMYYHLPK